jgi:NAD(P)-dependent dehydrogenase (short-subunit alcohol dehydrogenase family)|tara:strand:+ start:1954 stop:2814 length:861 start_codon:yes stop_codon:yes gene_type:complete
MADNAVGDIGTGVKSRFSMIGRTALITGSAGMLGRQHAAALLEVGASVILTDIDVDGLEVARDYLEESFVSTWIRTMAMDVTQIESVREVAEELDSEGVRVDVLINNAALDPKVGEDGLTDGSRLETFPVQRWNAELAVGLTGAFLCSQVFGTRMAAKGGGVILNMASDLSVLAPDQRIYRQVGLDHRDQPVKPVTYSVIKAGLVGLTRYLATYWPDSGVRVNALSPGGVQTDQPAEFVEKISDLVPLGRMAAPDEYRSAVQFLCSDASSFLTGQNIVIDGGRSVW